MLSLSNQDGVKREECGRAFGVWEVSRSLEVFVGPMYDEEPSQQIILRTILEGPVSAAFGVRKDDTYVDLIRACLISSPVFRPLSVSVNAIRG